MITYDVTESDEAMILIRHIADGTWVRQIKPLRCAQHDRGVEVSATGAKIEGTEHQFSVEVKIEGCCQALIAEALAANREAGEPPASLINSGNSSSHR